jgi:hypothetical protein
LDLFLDAKDWRLEVARGRVTVVDGPIDVMRLWMGENEGKHIRSPFDVRREPDVSRSPPDVAEPRPQRLD